MNTFTLILLFVCILFCFYKIIMRLLRIFIAKKSCDNHVELTVNHVNNCNLSSPSYDFPNIQSEVLKLLILDLIYVMIRIVLK